MKDLEEAKVIIGWEITRDVQARTLKINQKAYIQDLLESEKIIFYYPTVLSMKAMSAILID